MFAILGIMTSPLQYASAEKAENHCVLRFSHPEHSVIMYCTLEIEENQHAQIVVNAANTNGVCHYDFTTDPYSSFQWEYTFSHGDGKYCPNGSKVIKDRVVVRHL